jgi:hypothetical protein
MATRGLLERALLDILYEPSRSITSEQQGILERLTDWLLAQSGRGVTLISTNYDIAVESHLYKRRGGVPFADAFDFGISWLDPGANDLREHQRPAAASFRS